MGQDNSNDQFENSMLELESLVARLESGELSLAQSMQEFERGVALVSTCRKTLDEAEQRIKILTQKSQKIALDDLDVDVD